MVRPAKPVAARRRPATRPFDTIAVITAAILVAALAVGGNQWFLQVTEPDAKTSVMPKAGAKARTVGEITPIVNSPSAPSAAPQIPALRQSSSMKNGPMLLAFLAYNEASENYKQGRKLEAVEQCEIIIDALGRITPSPLLNIYDNAGGTMLRFAMELRARLNEDLGRGIEQGSKDLLEILSHAPGNRAIKTAYAQHQLHAGGDTALAMELVGGVADEDPHLKQSPTDTRDGVIVYGFAMYAAGLCAIAENNLLAAQRFFKLGARVTGDIQRASTSGNEKLPHMLLLCSFLTDVMSHVGGEVEAEASETLGALAALVPADEKQPSGYGKTMRFNGIDVVADMRGFFLSGWNFIASTTRVGGTCVLRERCGLLTGRFSPSPSLLFDNHAMLRLGMDAAPPEGLVLEFGVSYGSSLTAIASHFDEGHVHGFDTFTGLPEAWNQGGQLAEPKGSYSTFGVLPDVPDNVQLYEGLFAETLPSFLSAHRGPIRFMNIDCDLYSSTKDVFDAIHDRVVPGTVLIFDEYQGYPGWQQHEYRAFQEAVATHGWEFEYLAISLVTKQAAIRITSLRINTLEFPDGRVTYFDCPMGLKMCSTPRKVRTKMKDGTVQHFEGKSGAEHAVRVENSNQIQYYEGEEGLERMVRKEMADGSIRHYDGESGRLLFIKYLNGDLQHYKGGRGTERVVRVERANGKMLYYEGKRNEEKLVKEGSWLSQG